MRSGYSMTTPRRKNTTLSPVNRCQSISTSTPPNIHGSKIMLCIWWDQKDLVYYELLKPGNSITAIDIGYNWFVWAVHCEKNGRNTSKDMIKLFFFMTTLGFMFTKIVKKYLETLKWDVLPLPPFSGHCSFWLLVVPKAATSHRFTSFAEIENWFQNWIAFKDESFFRDGIRKLPERWEKVVGSDGQYFNWSVHSFCFEINAKKNGPN